MADNNNDGLDDATGLPVFDLSKYAGAAGAGDPQVLWGYTQPGQSSAKVPGGAGKDGAWIIPGMKGNTPSLVPMSKAQGYLWDLAQNDPQGYNDIKWRMMQSGLISEDATGAQIQQAWMAALGASADAQASGVNLTPWDAIDLLGGQTGNGKDAFTGTKSQTVNSVSTTSDTNRRVNLSSASEARAFILAAAEKELGRKATDKEIAAFRAALNGEENASAEVVKTTGTSTRTGTSSTTYKDGDAVASSDNTNTASSSNSVETGGMDRGQYAIDYARSANDWAEYQTATTYMNTLFAALQSPVDVGSN